MLMMMMMMIMRSVHLREPQWNRDATRGAATWLRLASRLRRAWARRARRSPTSAAALCASRAPTAASSKTAVRRRTRAHCEFRRARIRCTDIDVARDRSTERPNNSYRLRGTSFFFIEFKSEWLCREPSWQPLWRLPSKLDVRAKCEQCPTKKKNQFKRIKKFVNKLIKLKHKHDQRQTRFTSLLAPYSMPSTASWIKSPAFCSRANYFICFINRVQNKTKKNIRTQKKNNHKISFTVPIMWQPRTRSVVASVRNLTNPSSFFFCVCVYDNFKTKQKSKKPKKQKQKHSQHDSMTTRWWNFFKKKQSHQNRRWCALENSPWTGIYQLDSSNQLNQTKKIINWKSKPNNANF